jgi:hypothetical protein
LILINKAISFEELIEIIEQRNAIIILDIQGLLFYNDIENENHYQ